jgi:subtilisin family serine protease
MVKVRKKSKIRSLGLALVAVFVLGGIAFAGATFGNKPTITADTPTGDVKSVIVRFKDAKPVTASGSLGEAQKSSIEAAADKVQEGALTTTGYKELTRTFENLPYAVYAVDPEGEAKLKENPDISVVFDDVRMEVDADLPVPAIGGTPSGNFSDGSTNYTGNGYAVVVIDSGVDKNHPALSGKVIAEACFSENHVYSDATVTSLCPGGATSSTATGSGQDCTLPGACGHGTMVAGAVAMSPANLDLDNDGSTNDTVVGSAKDARIVAIKTTAQAVGAAACPTDPNNTCAILSSSGVIAAMDYATTLSVSRPIAAVNTSLGFGFAGSASECSAHPLSQAFRDAGTALKARGIAWVSSAGNSGDQAAYYNKTRIPACAGAITVGATNVPGTQISSYSNNSQFTTLLAPGGDGNGVDYDTYVWLPENGTNSYTGANGTSFSTPFTAGAYAVLREKHPNASVDSLTNLLQATGTPISDNRSGYTVGAKPKINVDDALAQSPYPTISAFNGPSGTVNEGQAITLTATVANATSCSLNNGIGQVTINSGSISRSVPGAASYTLTCVNAYGDSVNQTRNFTTNPAPTAPAITTQNFDKAARTFVLSWAASTDSDGIQEYRVYLNGQQVAVLPDTATSYTFENLSTDIAYTAEVRAVDSLGAISAAAVASFGSAPAGATDAPGTPNTGAQSLVEDLGARGIAVAILGLIVAVSIVLAVLKRRTR